MILQTKNQVTNGPFFGWCWSNTDEIRSNERFMCRLGLRGVLQAEGTVNSQTSRVRVLLVQIFPNIRYSATKDDDSPLWLQLRCWGSGPCVKHSRKVQFLSVWKFWAHGTCNGLRFFEEASSTSFSHILPIVSSPQLAMELRMVNPAFVECAFVEWS